jgi:hypothetical protein
VPDPNLAWLKAAAAEFGQRQDAIEEASKLFLSHVLGNEVESHGQH